MSRMSRFAATVVTLACFACSHRGTAAVTSDLPEQSRQVLRNSFPVYASAAHVQDPTAASPSEAMGDFRSSLPPALAERVRHHAALDWAALVCAQSWAQNGRAPGSALSQWLTWKVGVPGNGRCAVSHFGYKQAPRGDLAQKEARLATEARASFQKRASDAAEHLDVRSRHAFGIVRSQASRWRWVQAIFLVEEVIELQPVAKSHLVNGVVTFGGRYAAAREEPVVVMDWGRDRITRAKVEVREDGSFSTNLVLPSVPGRYFVEFRSTERDSRSRRRDLLVPLYVGSPEPSEPDLPLADELRRHVDASEWTAAVLGRINAERSRTGAAPLRENPRLASQANRHAREVLEHNNEIDPRLSTTLRAAGLDLYRLHQHVATKRDAQEFLFGLLVSPSTRAVLLAPAMSDFGLGMLTKGDNAVQFVLYVAARRPTVGDAEQEKQLLDALNEARTRLHLPPVAPSATAEAVATEQTAGLCTAERDVATARTDLRQLVKAGKVGGYRLISVPYVDRFVFLDHAAPWVTASVGGIGLAVCTRENNGEKTQHLVAVMERAARVEPEFEAPADLPPPDP